MTKATANVSPATLERLRWLGETRAMAYWTAAATGLRWGELRSVTLGACRLDADPPHLILEARHEKARRGATLPVPESLAAALRDYIAERRARVLGHSRGLAGHSGTVVLFQATTDKMPVFEVPEKMAKVFHADCRAAGIERSDSAGRVVDVHALRHTFGTMLAKAGVSLQVAQKAMRHSTPTLTANIYTHLTLIDTADAVGKLPDFCGENPGLLAQKAANLVAPTVAPKSGKTWCNEAKFGNQEMFNPNRGTDDTDRILTNKDNGLQEGAKKKMVEDSVLDSENLHFSLCRSVV